MSYLVDFKEHFRFVDLLDIAVISFVLYFTILWLRTRASRAVVIALALTLCVYALSRALDLYLTSSLFQVGLAFIVLSLVFIFQENLRRAFERMATWGRSRGDRKPEARSQTIDILVETATKFTGVGTGALIVVRGHESLDRHLRGGVALNGVVSLPLLQSIFDPHSPGHDGAVLVRGERIEKFSVHLPLSTNLRQLGKRGTRHAAALGLAECSDALIIVVSEERRETSVVHNGRLNVMETGSHLKDRLEDYYGQLYPAKRQANIWPRSLRNPGTKLAAVTTASLLWLFFAFRVERIERTYDVPIEYRNLATQFVLGENPPMTARVTLSGTERHFSKLQAAAVRVSLDLSNVKEGVSEIPVNDSNLMNAQDFTVTEMQPDEARIEVYRSATLELPVTPRFIGRLPSPLALAEPSISPAVVPVIVRWMDSRKPSALSTEPIDLSEIHEATALRVRLVLPPEARFAKDSPESVRVSVRVRSESSAASDSAAAP